MKLSELDIGKTATIQTVGGSGALRQHFWIWGFIQGFRGNRSKICSRWEILMELCIHGQLTITV